jgi:hypothetical protein
VRGKVTFPKKFRGDLCGSQAISVVVFTQSFILMLMPQIESLSVTVEIIIAQWRANNKLL